MFKLRRFPSKWPAEQQVILQRLQQSSTSPSEARILAATELICRKELIGSEEQRFLEQSDRFGALRCAEYIQINCDNAVIRHRVEYRKTKPDQKRPYICIVCLKTGRTIWRIPDEPHDPQFECITVTWYELP